MPFTCHGGAGLVAGPGPWGKEPLGSDGTGTEPAGSFRGTSAPPMSPAVPVRGCWGAEGAAEGTTGVRAQGSHSVGLAFPLPRSSGV